MQPFSITSQDLQYFASNHRGFQATIAAKANMLMGKPPSVAFSNHELGGVKVNGQDILISTMHVHAANNPYGPATPEEKAVATAIEQTVSNFKSQGSGAFIQPKTHPKGPPLNGLFQRARIRL